jgi:hypothetical protein
MCYPISCSTCGKTGWDGCGQHVDDVMRSVPVTARCTCSEDTAPNQDHRRSSGSLFGR